MRKLLLISSFLWSFNLFAQNPLERFIVNNNGDTVVWTENVLELKSSVDSKNRIMDTEVMPLNEIQSVQSAGFGGEAANWVFGDRIGMKFNQDGINTFYSSSMTSGEGCASISDFQGNLLLYTNGINVYNSLGQVINNQVLKGSNLSTQSGVIVPYPGNDQKYFVFTVPDTYETNPGLYYSIVDMSATNSQGGPGVLLEVEGSFEYKLVKENCVERLASVKHNNGADYWVISDIKGTNEFFCYKITENGIDIDNPIINAIGSAHIGHNTYGGVKFSQDGSKFASARGIHDTGDPKVEIFDFDNETGILSNVQDITPTASSNYFYGLEFSPDGNYLYVSTLERELIQINISSGESESILPAQGGFLNGGMLQIGIDDNMYYAIRGSGLFSFIDPNEKKMPESFSISEVNTSSGVKLGLPTFISSFTVPPACQELALDFYSYPHVCGTQFVPNVENENDCKIVSYLWDFGDGTTSTEQEPFHVYASPSVFEVELTMEYDCFDYCGETSNTVTHSVDLTEDIFENYRTIYVQTNIQENVLSATASSFSDNWPLEYDDVNLNGLHPYITGESGIWRNQSSYVYRKDRDYSETPNLSKDGTFSLETFNWRWSEMEAIPNWLKANTITKYNAYTYELENKDILGNYSAAIYGYGGQMPLAVGQNMSNLEMAYTGFEDLNVDGYNAIDDASQKGAGNWTISTNSEPYTSQFFEVKAGIGNLALVAKPLSDLEEIEEFGVFAQIGLPLPGLFGLGGPRKFSFTRNVGVLCKEPYELNNNWTVIVLDKVIYTQFWIGHLWHFLPGKRGDIVDISTAMAHTGSKSLRITSPKRIKQKYVKLEPSKEYVLGGWASINDRHLFTPVMAEGIGLRLIFYDENDTEISNKLIEPAGNIIEGWQKIEGKFIYPENAEYFSVEFDPGTASEAYFDDLRLFPAKGNMQTYVYELDSYRLSAVMDQNNYASLYYYDAEGNLFLVKKETTHGIKTIQESVGYQMRTDTE